MGLKERGRDEAGGHSRGRQPEQGHGTEASSQRGRTTAQEVHTLELKILISQQQEVQGTKLCGVFNATLRSCNLIKKGRVSWGWFLSHIWLTHSGKVEKE